MPYLLSLAGAIVLSMVLVPLAMRMAPLLGLVDLPDRRKVHSIPIPRVGGIGIVIGALGASLWWLPPEPLYQSFIFGALVLFVFGLVDDRYEASHYTKFVGQFIAAALVVFYGGLYVERIPFLSPHPIDPLVGELFTLFALVGVINAANHSDGLDGLAGGLTLISLAAMALIAHQAGGTPLVVLSLAVMGSIAGFLRFNTHPATVFMGDSGSQFLGFAAGFLVVLLTQRVNPALSPAVVALLLGLPVIDILAVFYLRASGGMNWFKATRNHIHHRLLDSGVSHQTTVIFIYGIQLLFVCIGFTLRYQSDALILAVYGLLVGALFALLVWLERAGTNSVLAGMVQTVNRDISALRRFAWVQRGPILLLSALLPTYLIGAVVVTTSVPPDFFWFSAALLLLAAGVLVSERLKRWHVEKAVVLPLVTFCVFLCEMNPPPVLLDLPLVQKVFFGIVACTIILDLKFGMDAGFRTTSLDYLAVFLVILVTLFSSPQMTGPGLADFAVKIIILFYGCELVLSHGGGLSRALIAGALFALAILSFRGFSGW